MKPFAEPSHKTANKINGILLIDKPIMFTSHDVVNLVRRKFKIRRVGHAGALDPMATGLLVILLGECTRLFDRYVKEDKIYEGVMTLGIQTDTQDLEGRITHSRDADSVSDDRIRDVFNSFLGHHRQQAPRYSSVKVNGAKCYEMARKNLDFERPFKDVEIKKLHIVRIFKPDIFFSAHVSKGTYIRALCDEIGQSLKTGAVLSGLRRTGCGEHRIGHSLNVHEFQNTDASELFNKILPSKDIA